MMKTCILEYRYPTEKVAGLDASKQSTVNQFGKRLNRDMSRVFSKKI